MANAPRVFLSYSHDSDEHAARVLALADSLCDGGIDVILDRYVHPAPVEGWPRWIERNLDEAKFVHSRPAFAFSLVLYPSSHRLLLRVAFPCGETTGLPHSADVPGWEGRSSSPVVRHLRRGNCEPRNLTTCLFGSSVVASFACWS